MPSSAARKGKVAEREISAILHDLTGWPVRRNQHEGRFDDGGDLEGLPECTAQVKWWANPTAAERQALVELPRQQANARTPFAVAFIRHPGPGNWVAVMTPGQFCALLREATS